MSTPAEPAPAEPTPAPAAQPSTPPAAQPAETDWKSEAKKWETRAKENFDKAQAHDTYVESQKTEAQKLTDRASKAERERDEARTDATSARTELLKYEVARDKNVPFQWIDRLKGSTKKELEEDADKLLQSLTPGFDSGVRKPADQPADMNTMIRRAAGMG